MRLRALAILVLLLPAAFPAAAQAHASLLRTDPAAGQRRRARARPDRAALRPAGARTPAPRPSRAPGASVLAARAHPSPRDVRALVVPLQPGLGRRRLHRALEGGLGRRPHRLRRRSRSGSASGPPPQAATTETSTLDWPFLIARFAYFCGLMLLVGGAVYRVSVFRPVMATLAGRPREMAELRESARANSLLLAAAALMLAGGWVALTREGAEVAGVSFWQAFNHHGPIGSALSGDAVRTRVRARDRPGRRVLRRHRGRVRRLAPKPHRRARPGRSGRASRRLGGDRPGPLRARRRPGPRPAGSGRRCRAHGRRGDLDRWPRSARAGDASRNEGPARRRPRTRAHRSGGALLAHRPRQRGGARPDRRRARALGGLLAGRAVADRVRPRAAREDRPPGGPGRPGLPQPPAHRRLRRRSAAAGWSRSACWSCCSGSCRS